MPGSRKNTNASGSGLYTKTPSVRVVLPDAAAMTTGGLAEYARPMADAAMSIATGLADMAAMAGAPGDAGRIAVLYARVADELYQLEGELRGETGIKAAALGKLPDAAYQDVMINRRAALELVISQIMTAWKRIQDRQEVAGTGLLDGAGGMNPVLEYLAGHMRTAKRMMREIAANLVWAQRGEDTTGDLAARLMELIQGTEER